MKRLLSLALMVSVAGPALAALEPKHYVARRLAADIHAQLAVAEVSERDGRCRVEARAERVFAGRLEPGEGLAFAVGCGEGAFWTPQRLRDAAVVEVFLKSGPTGWEEADDGEGMRALDAVTDQPAVKDDPALVREMTETITSYRIETEIKRGAFDAALALARSDDPDLRVRLLAQAAGLLAARHASQAEAAGHETLAALAALAPGEARRLAGLAALDLLARGGAAEAVRSLAGLLEPEIDALSRPSERDDGLLVLFGATLRTDDPTGALAALARVSDPKIRRDRLDTMVFALKDFGPADPASLAWLDRLLGAAEIQADPAFRAEALTALCRVAYRAATALAQRPEVQDKAAAMAEIAARRRHAPSAQVLALLTEMKGGAPARGEAARWTAIAAAGFDATERSRAEAMAALATFTAGERADAARLLGASGDASPQRLAALARR